MHGSGTLVGLPCVDVETLKIVVVYLHSEAFRQPQRHLDVGLGDEGVGDVEDHVGAGVGCGHQQGGEVLAADHPADVRGASGQPMGFDFNWRTARVELAAKRCPQLPQAVHQILNWAFAHSGYAVQHETSLSQRQGRSQRAYRGSGVAEHQFGPG